MKAILEFDLSNRDEEYAHLRCVKSSQMAAAIFEITHNLARKWKHSEKEPSLDEVMDEIHAILDQFYINVDELMA